MFDWAVQMVYNSAVTVENHKYIKVFRDSTGVSMTEEPKTDEDIEPLCEAISKEKNSTPVLHMLLTDAPSFSRIFPYSKKAFETLQTSWRIAATSFGLIPCMAATLYRPLAGQPEWQAICFGASTAAAFSLVVTHNSHSNQTYAIMVSCHALLAQKIMSAIEEIKPYAHHPEVLSFIVVMQYIGRVESWFEEVQLDFYAIRNSLKLDTYFDYGSDAEAPDITNTPQALTSLLSVLWVLCACQSEVEHQISVLEELMADFRLPESEEVKFRMKNYVAPLRSRNQHFKVELKTMIGTGQAMVQMVYAMLQQRDNEINHRYAANVHVITAITLIFLPGTFVATLFSSSFWNFEPGSDGPVVSSWIWLYFFLTAALTLVVLGIWRGYTVLKQVIKTSKGVWRNNAVLKWMRRSYEQSDEESGKKAA